MHKDNEMQGIGNSLDFGARVYDTRVGRFLSLDPLMKKFPSISPYIYAQNSPLAMIDKEGERGEIIINKKSQERGAAITMVNVNMLLLTTQKRGSYAEGSRIELIESFKYQLGSTYQRKEFSGRVDKHDYKASFNFDIRSGLSNEELRDGLRGNPVANYITVDGKDGKGNPMGTFASGRLINYSTNQRQTFPNPFAHEVSHLLGGDGDMFFGNNYMSNYTEDRNVQDEEVNELLAPAIRLANEVEGKSIKIHFFNSTDENGNNVKNGGGKYNTYKVYDESSETYLKSETVPVINPNPNR